MVMCRRFFVYALATCGLSGAAHGQAASPAGQQPTQIPAQTEAGAVASPEQSAANSKEARDFLDALMSGRFHLAQSGKQRKPIFSLLAEASAVRSTNAYGNNNLGDVFPFPAQGDQIARLSLQGAARVNISSAEQLSGSVVLGRQFFGKETGLNFNFGSIGAQLVSYRLKGLAVQAVLSCDREFEHGTVYRACGPDLSLRNAPELLRFGAAHLELEGGAFSSWGRNLLFEDFYGAHAAGLLVGQWGQTSAYVGAQYLFRRFKGGYGALVGLDSRRDHRLTIPVGIQHALTRRLAISLEATETINWSNYDEYRYSDFSVGPRIQWELVR